jgi:hypothetical protein
VELFPDPSTPTTAATIGFLLAILFFVLTKLGGVIIVY